MSTKTILFDSNIYIDLFRGELDIDRYKATVEDAAIYYSIVVLHEVLRGSKDQQEVQAIYSWLDEFHDAMVVPTSLHWLQAANLIRLLVKGSAKNKRTLNLLQNDLLIAFAAAQTGATLVTKNRKDFELIAKLLHIRCEYW